jgi:hypothetical protein
VLDEQHRVVAADVLDEVDNLTDALRGDASVGFVEEQYVRIAGKCNPDFEFPLFAVAETLSELLGSVVEADPFENLVGLLLELVVRREVPPEVQ